jgi:hypothetical protein
MYRWVELRDPSLLAQVNVTAILYNLLPHVPWRWLFRSKHISTQNLTNLCEMLIQVWDGQSSVPLVTHSIMNLGTPYAEHLYVGAGMRACVWRCVYVHSTAHILGARSPWQLNFVRRRLTFVGPQCGICVRPGAYLRGRGEWCGHSGRKSPRTAKWGGQKHFK